MVGSNGLYAGVIRVPPPESRAASVVVIVTIARAIALIRVLKAIRPRGRESSARLELNRVAELGFIQSCLILIGFRTRANRRITGHLERTRLP